MTKKPLTKSAPAHRNNYSSGRKGNAINTIVVHTMQGTLKGTNGWFADAAAKASAHYGIGFGGELVQYVDDQDTAWHAGNAKYNRQSIGIELEGFMERGFFPDTMIDKLVELMAYLCDTYKIPRDRKHIIGHNEVPAPDGKGFGGAGHHADPGPKFPWDEVMAKLQVYSCEKSVS